MFFGPGIGASTVRLSGDIDVHIVTHEHAAAGRRRPRMTGALTSRRRGDGVLLACALLAVATVRLANMRHDLTLLAYDMNGEPLNVLHGAPLRLRCENQLGYKMVKWIAAIEFVADFAHLGAGQGGYNEDHEFYGSRMPSSSGEAAKGSLQCSSTLQIKCLVSRR